MLPLVNQYGFIQDSESYFSNDNFFNFGFKDPLNAIRPWLNITDLEDIKDKIEVDFQLQKQLGSQGFYALPNGKGAYSHESSYTAYIQGIEKTVFWDGLLNADSGGFRKSEDGQRTIAYIADGMGSKGVNSAFAAWAVGDFFLSEFAKKTLGFTLNLGINRAIAHTVLDAAWKYMVYKLTPHIVDAGTTAIFVDCVPNGNTYQLQAISLGDGAIVHISTQNQIVSQLTSSRQGTNKGLCGGALCVREGVYAKDHAQLLNLEIQADDIVVLLTDGFTDNVYEDISLEYLVKLVVQSSFFDQSFQQQYEIYKATQTGLSEVYDPELPTFDHLKACVEPYPEEWPSTAEIATRRLAAYVKLATFEQQKYEEMLYQTEYFLEQEVKRLTADWMFYAKEWVSNVRGLEKRNEILKTLTEIEKKKEAIKKQLDREIVSDRKGKAKLDDCMICAFSPNLEI